jgi:hypothetical protein
MQNLQEEASEWSSVATAGTFAIDNGNLFEALGGTTQPFVDLSTNFYIRSIRPAVPLLRRDSIRSDLNFFSYFAVVCWLIGSSTVYVLSLGPAMQYLQEKASEWSGVATAGAFAIDNGNLFEALGGTTQPFVDLSTNFYTRSVRPAVPLLHRDSIRSEPRWRCPRPRQI